MKRETMMDRSLLIPISIHKALLLSFFLSSLNKATYAFTDASTKGYELNHVARRISLFASPSSPFNCSTNKHRAFTTLSNQRIIPNHGENSKMGRPGTKLFLVPPLPLESTGMLTGVEVFDGSTIVDPVVVSSAFWTGLQTKILSVIIGQFLAASVFAILSSIAASQLTKLGELVSSKVFNEKVQDSVSTFAESIETKAQL